MSLIGHIIRCTQPSGEVVWLAGTTSKMAKVYYSSNLPYKYTHVTHFQLLCLQCWRSRNSKSHSVRFKKVGTLYTYSRLPNVGTGAFIWQISPTWQIWHWQIWDWPTWQNLPNKGTGAYIRQARVHILKIAQFGPRALVLSRHTYPCMNLAGIHAVLPPISIKGKQA